MSVLYSFLTVLALVGIIVLATLMHVTHRLYGAAARYLHRRRDE